MPRSLLAPLPWLIAVLVACAPLRGGAPDAEPPAVSPLPSDEYHRLASRHEPVLRIDPARSLVVIEVRRAGSLAELGHDHVVASRSVEGFIAPRAGRADAVVALATLEVDEPSLRRAAGMDTQPSAADAVGTRRNMLGPVLEAERYPFASVAVRSSAFDSGQRLLPVALTLHGVARTIEVPASIDVQDSVATVSGAFAVAQTDFGITPFSLLGGAIAVRDRIDVRFRLVAVLQSPE